MERLFVHCFQIELKFGVLFFVEWGKPENPENPEKTLGTRRERTTNSTHTWHRAGIDPGSY